jgi:DNA-binding NarL/FixJ family response regulator
LREAECNVIFLDDELPGMDIHARKAIIRSFPLLKAIMLTISTDKEYIRNLFAEGASGCMAKTALDNEYRLAVKTVTANKKFYCAETTNLLFNEQAEIPTAEESIIQQAGLTKREAEVYPYLVKKVPGKKIAELLFIDYETFRKHRRSIRKKLNAIGMLYILDHLIKPLSGREEKEIMEKEKKKK